MTVKYKYLGKPPGTLALKRGEWVELEQSRWTPPNDGLVLWLVYLNITGPPGARVRIRMVRSDPFDESSLHDIPLDGANTRETHTYFEWGDADRRCHWELRADRDGITVGTRYTKAAQIT